MLVYPVGFLKTVPAPVTGMSCWLRGDTVTLNGSNVSSWTDKSGNGRHFIQGTAGDQPLYVASGGAGGQPYVDSQGADWLTSDTGSGSADFVTSTAKTFFMVFKVETTGNGGLLSADSGAAEAVIGIRMQSSTGLFATNFDGSQDSTSAGSVNISMSTWSALQCTHDGSTLSLLVSGFAAATVSSGSTSGISNFQFKLMKNNHAVLDCHVAELLTYNTVLSAANLSKNRAYITSRYGITW